MVRFYYTHKRGETYSDIQDSIGIDEGLQRYAVSHGVTNSFLPQVLSRILTKEFVSSGMANFPPPNLQELFTIEREAYLNSLDEDQRFLQEMVEEEFKDSAATFVGVEFANHLIRWKLIGDSCLFIQPDNGILSCYCSNEVRMDNDNNLHIVFDSRPSRRKERLLKASWIFPHAGLPWQAMLCRPGLLMLIIINEIRFNYYLSYPTTRVSSTLSIWSIKRDILKVMMRVSY